MCQPTITPRYGMPTCTCGCGSSPPFRRLFSLKEEQEWIESYRDQLTKELAGVEERIKELKSK